MDFRTSLIAHLPEEEVDALLKALSLPTSTHALLLNTKKMSDEVFLRRYPNVRKHPLVEHAYLYDKEVYDFGRYLLYDNGVYSIQDAASMMAPYFLAPQEDDVILDMCAAPGGKSIGMSLAMLDKGLIVSNDISYPRAKAMSQNVERMGRGNIIVASNDFVFTHVHFQNTFDKIILDAPCSGSAMMRKNEEAKSDWSFAKVKRNARIQAELIELAYGMLKEGGTLLYSTCSFNYEEDEAIILSFKEAHPEIEILSFKDDPSFYHHPDLPEAIRLHPNRFVGEGQFICALRKPGTLSKAKPICLTEDKHYHGFIAKYGLEGRSNEMMRGKFYSLSQHFDCAHLNILRYGVKLFEMRSVYIPDHHLCHYLTPDYAIPLTYEEAKAYIHGDTFLRPDLPDDFYIISYDNQNLGFIKVTQGVCKNHYPKGLRRELKD